MGRVPFLATMVGCRAIACSALTQDFRGAESRCATADCMRGPANSEFAGDGAAQELVDKEYVFIRGVDQHDCDGCERSKQPLFSRYWLRP